MLLRILIVPAVLLAFTLSCSPLSQPDASPEKEPELQTPDDRPVTSRFLSNNDIYRAFAYFHSGDQKIPLENFKFGKGFQLDAPWFWTVSDQAEMTILPPHPVLKKDTVLEIPKLSFFFRGKKQKFQAEFQINGTTVLQQEFSKKSPTSIQLKIPARLNQSATMNLTIKYTGIGNLIESDRSIVCAVGHVNIINQHSLSICLAIVYEDREELQLLGV